MGSGSPVAPPEEGAQAADRLDRFQARPRLTGNERFLRSGRLVRKADIDFVVRSGRKARRTYLDIHWTTNETGHSRMGLIVPRFQQTAVARNLLRRRLKDIWRTELGQKAPPRDVVLRARRESYRASFLALREDFLGWCGATGW